MFLRLLALFIVVPLVELAVLLRLADATSGWMTLAIVIVTGLVGTVLAQREGIAAWRRFQSAIEAGRVPGREIRDGLMIAFAAALLLTPGLLTDTLGFALLTPWGRRCIGGFLASHLTGRVEIQSFGPSSSRSSVEDAGPTGSADPRSGGGGRWTIDSPSFGPRRSA